MYDFQKIEIKCKWWLKKGYLNLPKSTILSYYICERFSTYLVESTNRQNLILSSLYISCWIDESSKLDTIFIIHILLNIHKICRVERIIYVVWFFTCFVRLTNLDTIFIPPILSVLFDCSHVLFIITLHKKIKLKKLRIWNFYKWNSKHQLYLN